MTWYLVTILYLLFGGRLEFHTTGSAPLFSHNLCKLYYLVFSESGIMDLLQRMASHNFDENDDW